MNRSAPTRPAAPARAWASGSSSSSDMRSSDLVSATGPPVLRQPNALRGRRLGSAPISEQGDPVSLNGRVALVSGGGRGIGQAISLRLARDGADVAVNYRRDEEAAAKTVAQIEELGRRAKAYRASVDSWDDDVAMVEQVLGDFGFVDILVHNGGIASRGLSVADTDPGELDRVIRTHAYGGHYLSKLVVPQMRTRERGD